MDYALIELMDQRQYVLVDMFEYQNKKYFLLSGILNDKSKLNKNFEIYLYNEINNMFEIIEDELEYNFVKTNFLEKLKLIEQRLNASNDEMPFLIKLKVKKIDGYNYILEKTDGEIIKKNIEIYGNVQIKENDYIYMLNSSVKEKSLFQYGPLMNNHNEIIKIVNGENEYYLQRYYG